MKVEPRNWMKPGPIVRDCYVGVDLGQKRDYTVVVVAEKKDGHVTLRHIKRFPLGTEYTAILDYLGLVQERFQTVRGFFIDQTGVGEVFVENARKHGLHNVQGIVLTLSMKQEVMTCIKQGMQEKRLHLPRDHELEIEMNGEIAELTSTGKTKFYHRTGTHDDRLWALGLAVYGARHDIVTYHPVAVLGKNPNYIGPWFNWRLFRRGGSTYVPRPGDPPGVVVHGQLWCWFCRRPVLTRPHVCEKL
jgi:phage FluMu gp28-like protein